MRAKPLKLQKSGQGNMPKELDSGSLFKEYEIQRFVQVQSFQVRTTVPKKLLLLAVLIQKLFL